ncbi:MAG: FHA domain-containing protein [Gammaproteobacteria bacterium]
MSKLTLSFKGRVLRVFPLQQGVTFIGNDPACLIHIDSLAVEPKHARIEVQGQDAILFDMSGEEGTFVNQEKISEYKLKDNDQIRVGKHTLSYTYEEVNQLDANESSTSIDIHPVMEQLAEQDTETRQIPAATGHKQGWLQILNGQNLGKTLSLNRSMTNLGKPGVATAVITRRQDGFFISHLEGKKSPMVGDKSIGEHSIKLEDGDTITIGNIKMQFYLE